MCVLDRVAAFEEWAVDEGVSLDRFIQREQVHSQLRETTQTVIRFPAMTVAEYVDGNLACVTPYETESGVVSVQDRLDTLEGQSQESG